MALIFKPSLTFELLSTIKKLSSSKFITFNVNTPYFSSIFCIRKAKKSSFGIMNVEFLDKYISLSHNKMAPLRLFKSHWSLYAKPFFWYSIFGLIICKSFIEHLAKVQLVWVLWDGLLAVSIFAEILFKDSLDVDSDIE